MAVRARRTPSLCLEDDLLHMQRYLGRWEAAADQTLPRVLTHFGTVFNQRYSRYAVGLRTTREMRTLAEALLALLQCNVPWAGDLVVHRFTVLETSVVHRGWSVARHHEFIARIGQPDLPERKAGNHHAGTAAAEASKGIAGQVESRRGDPEASFP